MSTTLPNIVFEGADLDAAVNGTIAAIFGASGQTCIAGSGLLVEERIHDDFVDRLVGRATTIRMGDPPQIETGIGPAATPDQLTKIQRYAGQERPGGAERRHGRPVQDPLG